MAIIIPPSLNKTKFWLSCVGDFTKMHNCQMESDILTLGSNVLIWFPGRCLEHRQRPINSICVLNET